MFILKDEQIQSQIKQVCLDIVFSRSVFSPLSVSAWKKKNNRAGW